MLYIGPKPTMVLHGYEAVKEALIDQGDKFLGRGPIPIISDVQNGYGMFQIKIWVNKYGTSLIHVCSAPSN